MKGLTDEIMVINLLILQQKHGFLMYGSCKGDNS